MSEARLKTDQLVGGDYGRRGVWIIALLLLMSSATRGFAMQVTAQASDQGRAGVAASKPPKSPQEAFDAGLYDQAVAGFAERAERRPDDAKAQFNLGSALHQLSDYDGAKAAFERALTAETKVLRAKALYDLGNTAYRQGQLEQAIDRYGEALELTPDDEDAKYNLEFVQRELERRQEQAEQRQQGGEQDQPQDQQEQQDGDQSQQNGNQDQNQDGQQQDQKDSDGDGLSDQAERDAENPTDPNRADSDGDGRSDGEEDQNRNGRVDEGESNPNRRDEAPAEQANGQPEAGEKDESDQGEGGNQDGQAQPVTLSPEQAQRLLAALQDQRPTGARKLPDNAQTAKSAKDW